MPFIESVTSDIKELIEEGLISKLAFMGLSRGGWVSCQIAARIKKVSHVLAFAPLTELQKARELIKTPLTKEHDLYEYLEDLHDRSIRFYIGNRDSRVSTRRCFSFIEALADKAHDNRIRSNPIELIITPSIGMHGHGTAKHIFESGAQWICDELL